MDTRGLKTALSNSRGNRKPAPGMTDRHEPFRERVCERKALICSRINGGGAQPKERVLDIRATRPQPCCKRQRMPVARGIRKALLLKGILQTHTLCCPASCPSMVRPELMLPLSAKRQRPRAQSRSAEGQVFRLAAGRCSRAAC